ncbi:outer membrane protein [Methylocapsa sp. S129]|uniref:outer membrane protein n=1 Tax=Methylocapsa sp. S129 TaxID=1641869 RepID=UPI001FF03EB6|nr:outer membrane beta-barrel protein [Methylocapsa sp. S129]
MSAPDFSGWYLRGDVGMALQTGSINTNISPNPLIGLPSDAFNSFYNTSLSAAALFDVGVGYQINNWLRFDVTGEYRGGSQFQTLEQVGIPSTSQQFGDFYRGNMSSVIGLVNGYVDIGTWYGMTPFVGAGVGFANNTLSGMTDTGFACGVGCSPSGGYFSDKSKMNFAWALMAGLDFNVTQNLKLELGYRFLDYGKAQTASSNCFNGTGAGGGFSAANCGGSGYVLSTRELYSQDFRLGLRWAFNDMPSYTPEPEQPLVRKY